MKENGLQARLSVSRQRFIEALTLLARQCSLRRGDEAILSFDEANLLIDVGGISCAIPAQGFWPGQMRYPVAPLVALRKLLPENDPLLIDVEDGALRMGSTTLGGHWQPMWSAQIELPINAPLAMVLALKYQYTEKEIEMSGLLERYRRAWERAARAIARAAGAIEPLGITSDELWDWVEAKIKEKGSLGGGTRPR